MEGLRAIFLFHLAVQAHHHGLRKQRAREAVRIRRRLVAAAGGGTATAAAALAASGLGDQMKATIGALFPVPLVLLVLLVFLVLIGGRPEVVGVRAPVVDAIAAVELIVLVGVPGLDGRHPQIGPAPRRRKQLVQEVDAVAR